jgi:tRNA threonylcarbamoyladenosine biosynthesis protein TsaB
MTNPQPRLLILETSDRTGRVAIAEGPALLEVRTLTEARRHARDLAPAVADLLTARRWRPKDVDGVVVSRGPGSYTGLRVGIMSAKTFAFVTGCRLLGIDTFAAIAAQGPADCSRVDVLADAQQDKVYCQPFLRLESRWTPAGTLEVCPFSDWLQRREPTAAVTGPGLEKWDERIPAEVRRLPLASRHPTPESLLRLGLERLSMGEYDDPLSLEPLYLRPSAAERQWRGQPARAGE